jgi:CRISPR-associated endonuclease Csn1
MEKVLGLDLGITSVGSALLDLDYNNLKNTNILHCNIRIFEAPITSKEKTSLQLIRGENRRARNSKENNAIRRKKIVNVLIRYKLIDKYEIKNINTNLPKSKSKREIIVKTANYLFENKKNANDVLELRYKALNEKLSNIELARLLYSINNHRGVSYEDTRSSKNISEKKP